MNIWIMIIFVATMTPLMWYILHAPYKIRESFIREKEDNNDKE